MIQVLYWQGKAQRRCVKGRFEKWSGGTEWWVCCSFLQMCSSNLWLSEERGDGKKRSKNAPIWKKKAFNNEKAPPPHKEINVAKKPFFNSTKIPQKMLYISWIFVFASHSTNIFLLFIPHRTKVPKSPITMLARRILPCRRMSKNS